MGTILKTEVRTDTIISEKCYPSIPLSLQQFYGHYTLYLFFLFCFVFLLQHLISKSFATPFLNRILHQIHTDKTGTISVEHARTHAHTRARARAHTHTQQLGLWIACCIYPMVSSTLETFIYTISMCITQYSKLKRILRKTVGPYTKAVTEEWRALQYEELQTLYCSPVLLG